MVEAVIGGLVGAVVALIGTVLVVRDTRRGRESSSEEKAAAGLLTQFRRVRLDPSFLDDQRANTDFVEECLAHVLAFRDEAVRKRLATSVGIIASSSTAARIVNAEFHASDARSIAFADARRCMEARLDRKRLPKPDDDWMRAKTNLLSYLRDLDAELEAAEGEADRQREDFLDSMNPY